MIPKIVHVAWKDKDVLGSDHPIIVNGIRKFIELNPDWKVTVNDNNDIDEYLKDHLGVNDYNLIKDKHIVEKCDAWRLIKMYVEGGMYVDIDRVCNLQMPALDDNIKWVLPTCRSYDFSQDIMISEGGNPVFLMAIDLMFTRRHEGHTNTYFLGSQTYMHAITLSLFNKVIDTNPGEEVFNWMVEKIEKIPFIRLIREDPPYNTLLHNSDSSMFDHEQWKRDFYKSSGIRHWTDEW
ncbi:MAG: hypothetical protein EBU08_04775 [Micrococcales bacterium]|nr:hypothetical protein [Micrococcales bacterium]